MGDGWPGLQCRPGAMVCSTAVTFWSATTSSSSTRFSRYGRPDVSVLWMWILRIHRAAAVRASRCSSASVHRCLGGEPEGTHRSSKWSDVSATLFREHPRHVPEACRQEDVQGAEGALCRISIDAQGWPYQQPTSHADERRRDAHSF